ncbi:hypothetical protein TNCV_91411 [Trichonephila clavipes]|nr:hypothetical protein TNCV_91411 [Trichonephila clavipes]
MGLDEWNSWFKSQVRDSNRSQVTGRADGEGSNELGLNRLPVADGVRSPKKELPCLLRFDWPKPIDAESGRGNGLSRSENKRPETRRSWN